MRLDLLRTVVLAWGGSVGASLRFVTEGCAGKRSAGGMVPARTALLEVLVLVVRCFG